MRTLTKHCSYCNVEETEHVPLRDCARCGMQAYCSKSCQTAAYPEHRAWCRQAARDYNADDAEGAHRILFSRQFGGAVGLFMHQAKLRQGRGIVRAVCSHPLKEYCGARRMGNNADTRSITLTYVKEGPELLELQSALAGEAQSDVLLSSMLQCEDSIYNQFRPVHGDSIDKMFCSVALEQPSGAKYLRTYMFFTYLSLDHPAHAQYNQVLQDPHFRFANDTVTLNWDWKQPNQRTEAVQNDDVLQWLFYNSIGAEFYRKCSQEWQRRYESGDRSPWPGGVLTPPVALQINVEKGSVNAEAPWSMVITT